MISLDGGAANRFKITQASRQCLQNVRNVGVFGQVGSRFENDVRHRNLIVNGKLVALRFRTREYKVSRLQLAYLASEEYLRTFWWYVAVVPVFGIIALLIGNGMLQAVGLMAILWPISIPARALFSTTKASRLLDAGTWMAVRDGEILFHGPDRRGLKITVDSIRDSVIRQRHVLVRTRRLGFVPVPVDAFSIPGDVDAFRNWISEQVQLAYDKD